MGFLRREQGGPSILAMESGGAKVPPAWSEAGQTHLGRTKAPKMHVAGINFVRFTAQICPYRPSLPIRHWIIIRYTKYYNYFSAIFTHLALPACLLGWVYLGRVDVTISTMAEWGFSTLHCVSKNVTLFIFVIT